MRTLAIALAAAGPGTTDAPGFLSDPDNTGIEVCIDITAITGTPTLTVTVQWKDKVSGKVGTLLASAALAAVGTTRLKVFPGATAVANLAANDVISPEYQIRAVVAGAASTVTATISTRSFKR